MEKSLIKAHVVLPVPLLPITMRLLFYPTTLHSSYDNLNLICYKLGTILINLTRL